MNEKVRKTISRYHALLGRHSGKKVSSIEDLLSLNSFSRMESHAMKVSAGETKIDRSARRVDNSWQAEEVCRITLWVGRQESDQSVKFIKQINTNKYLNVLVTFLLEYLNMFEYPSHSVL